MATTARKRVQSRMTLSLDSDLQTLLQIQNSIFIAELINPKATFQGKIAFPEETGLILKAKPSQQKVRPVKTPSVPEIKVSPTKFQTFELKYLKPPIPRKSVAKVTISPTPSSALRYVKKISLPQLVTKRENIPLSPPRIVERELPAGPEEVPTASDILAIDPARLAAAAERFRKGSTAYTHKEMIELAKRVGVPHTGAKHVLYTRLVEKYRKAGGQYPFPE